MKQLNTGEKYGLKTKTKQQEHLKKFKIVNLFYTYVLSVWVRILIPGG